MSRLEIVLLCSLLLSFGLNVMIFAYARAAITRLLSVSEELGDLQEMIGKFSEHVRNVYNLDMFYGDETLKYLMEHATALNNQLEENFEHIYSLTDTDVETEDIIEEEEEIETAENDP